MVPTVILSVILFSAIQGCLGDDPSLSFFKKFCDDAKNCADDELGERLSKINYVPTTEQELNAFCPSITKTMWCIVQVCSGKNIFCSNSPINQTNNFITSALSVGNIFLEICTIGSELRQKYLADISCIKNSFSSGKFGKKCLIEGYQTWLSSDLSIEGATEEDRRKDMTCLSVLNTIACLVPQIEKHCGRDAGETFQEIVIKVKPLKWLTCNEANLQELKTRFLKSRILDDERKEIFASFF